jgi:ribosomal protein S18 acetylase RimI-like enzyme
VAHQVLDARPDDLPAVARTLARAFADDPVFEVLFGAPVPQDRCARFFRAATAMAHRKDPALVQRTAGDEGAAVWAPPGAWRSTTREALPHVADLVRAFGRRLPRSLRVLQVLEEHHPDEPHWYLEFIGTDPAHQGTGVGSALLQPMADRCDQEGLGAYLESSKEQNLAFYGRFGFEVIERVELPGGAPEWLMWREPR